MQITALIDAIDVQAVRGDLGATEVRAVDFDSRQVEPGSLFCCVPGERTDGHLHAGEAVSRGATALLCDHFLDLDVTQIRVAPDALRSGMAQMASAFYGHPSRSMTMVGVTGTNGKTTVTQLMRSILERAGLPTGVVGTLDGERTTPEAPLLQQTLAGIRDEGRRAVAMEVSSHALTQQRASGIMFDVAVFTNLSRDHLDHHGSMEDYFAAKATLFAPSMSRRCVVDVDDPWGARLAAMVTGRALVEVRRSDATDIDLSVGRSAFRWRGHQVTTPLTGLFNVDNALLAAAVATELGVDEDVVVEGLGSAAPVPGRMEVVTAGPPFAVIVDYAHTPAGLEVALASARELAGSARVICVFGCGGDRDRGKRPEMGAVAARGADVVVLTSDNPRSEDPLAIIDEIRSGMGETVHPTVAPDRAEAIDAAVAEARAGDVVLVAGKGHETVQVAAGRSVPFDDRAQARASLADRLGEDDAGGGTTR